MATNNAAPDSIDDGRLRQGGKISPAAQVISQFRGASRDDVADAQHDNSYKQLGEALAKFTGTAGVTLQREEHRQQTMRDLAKGEEASRQMQKRNVQGINDAVKQGLIPAGASPVFEESVRLHQLGAAADKRKQSLSEAYWNSEEGAAVRASSDVGKFDEFVKKHNDAFDYATFQDSEGNGIYTELDRYKSKYGDRADQDKAALYREHLAYRVTENEKAAETVAGQRTTYAIEEGLDNGLSHAQIATAISGIYRDPTTGLVTNGMKASKQSQLTVDAVIDAAVHRKDIKILDMLDAIPTDNPKAFLGGTLDARKKVAAARLHITQEVWMESERNRTMAERRGAGIATDPEVEQRAKEIRDRSEADYAVKVKQLAQHSNALDKAVQAEPEQSAIIQHLANGGNAFSHEVVGHMKNLAKVDPTAAMHMMTYVQGQQLKQKAASDETATLNTYTRLRADLSNDPASFDRGRIIAESNRGNLTAGQVSSLFENAESSAKAAKEYPILQSDLVKQMRTDIRAASMTNPLDEFGSGRLRADSAANEFNDIVLDYIKTHPQAGAYEISKAMRPEVERLARRHNAELDQTMSINETRAANEKLHNEQAAAKAKREEEYAQPPKPLTAAEKREALKKRN